MRGKKIVEKKDREELESGERLREWIRAYGISEKTATIKGADRHVERLRGQKGDKIEKERGGFTFTFKKVQERMKEEARGVVKIGEERKRKREEDFREMERKNKIRTENRETIKEGKGDIIKIEWKSPTDPLERAYPI